jgi:heat shock protein HtpX
MANSDTIDHFTQRRHRTLNTVQTWLLAGGSLVLLAITAWAFGGWTGIIYAVVFGAISMIIVRRVSPQMVLTMYKAQPVSRAEFPAGVEIVEELARRAGLPAAPRLYVVPSKMMNAFAVGRREDSAIAITDALARNLTLRELAGVLAHEMSHVAHEDVKVMAFADMVARFTSLMSTLGLISLFLNIVGFAGGMEAQVPWLAVLVLLAAPTIGGLLQLALSRTREFDADLGAALLTGDPDGLASALTKLERAQGRAWENVFLPTGRNPNPSVLRTHPLTAERVKRLMALKAGVDPRLPGPPPAVRPRPSLVPRVRPQSPTLGGVGFGLVEGGIEPEAADEVPACHASIYPPEGNPRIRVRRGGVWW